jgi:hypothetical protein
MGVSPMLQSHGRDGHATFQMPRTPPQFDRRLIGVWSRELVDLPSSSGDVRILFKPNYSGRYETWHKGLNEVITFNWSPPSQDRVTLAGLEYFFRDNGNIRREPCNWHFEAVPYGIEVQRLTSGDEKPVLRLQFGPQRVDHFALLSESFAGFEEARF